MSMGTSMQSEQTISGIRRRSMKTAALFATVLLVSVLNPHLASAQPAPSCPTDPTADVQGCINQNGSNNGPRCLRCIDMCRLNSRQTGHQTG